MKFQIKTTFSLLLVLVLLALAAAAQAAGQGRLRLSLEDATTTAAQEVTVAVLVEDAPQIYGADVYLLFDPDVLEVVDADDSQAGVQLEPGDFINFEQAFVLQHQVDNQAGRIDYALALLNPAPPAQGDGRLLRITFRAKADGQTTIRLESAMFGTQTGETITPQLENDEISLAVTGGGQNLVPAAVDEDFSEATPLPAPDETGRETIVSETPPSAAEETEDSPPPSTAEETEDSPRPPAVEETGDSPRPPAAEGTEADSNSLFDFIMPGSGGMILALAALGGLGLAIGWFWLNRSRRSNGRS